MEDSRRILFAIALSLAVLFLWQYLYVIPQQRENQRLLEIQQAAQEAQQEARGENSQNADTISITAPPVSPTNSVPTLRDREEILADAPAGRINIENEKISGSISLKGARFNDLNLTDYRQTQEEGAPAVPLLSPSGSKSMYFAETGWLTADKSLPVPKKDTLWKSTSSELSPTSPVTLTWDNGKGLLFTRTIAIDEHYLFTVTETVTNSGDRAATLSPYGLINRTRPDSMLMFISHEGPIGVFNNRLEEESYDSIQDDQTTLYKGVNGWLGIADKYWLTAFIPDNSLTFDGKFAWYEKNDVHRYQTDYRAVPQTIQAGSSISLTHHFFAGAKEVHTLDYYADELKFPLFDRAIDLGWLYLITKPIYLLLLWLEELLGNFGLAILAMTVIIKALLFPLANKGYKSMARIRELAPYMKELKERYGEDRTRLNSEMMKLYKEKKINPMAGCLPILVQIPIFFALYKVLFVTIEMRLAPFYGWIHDLSAPDPTNIFNLFGLIDWAPPAVLPAIGILPILFGLSMYFQQKMSPAPLEGMQLTIIRTMPIVFTILFAGLPAGLVLYWTWNGILSIAQQYVINKNVHREMQREKRK